MANPWISFLSSWRKSHPKVSMKQAMRLAAKDYKKKGTTTKKKVKKVKKVSFGPDVKIVQKATQKVGGSIKKGMKLGGAIRDDVREMDVYTP